MQSIPFIALLSDKHQTAQCVFVLITVCVFPLPICLLISVVETRSNFPPPCRWPVVNDPTRNASPTPPSACRVQTRPVGFGVLGCGGGADPPFSSGCWIGSHPSSQPVPCTLLPLHVAFHSPLYIAAAAVSCEESFVMVFLVMQPLAQQSMPAQ